MLAGLGLTAPLGVAAVGRCGTHEPDATGKGYVR